LAFWSGRTTYCGYDINYDLVKGYLTKICKCDSDFGSRTQDISAAIRRIQDLHHEYYRYFTARKVVNHIENGGCVIITYNAEYYAWCHYSLVIKSNKKDCVNFVNYYEGSKPEKNVSYTDLKSIIKSADKTNTLGGFFIQQV
jgi:hypothetical protein